MPRPAPLPRPRPTLASGEALGAEDPGPVACEAQQQLEGLLPWAARGGASAAAAGPAPAVSPAASAASAVSPGRCSFRYSVFWPHFWASGRKVDALPFACHGRIQRGPLQKLLDGGITPVRFAFSGLNSLPLKILNMGFFGGVQPRLQPRQRDTHSVFEQCTRTSTCTILEAADSGARGPAQAKVITSAELSVAN